MGCCETSSSARSAMLCQLRPLSNCKALKQIRADRRLGERSTAWRAGARIGRDQAAQYRSPDWRSCGGGSSVGRAYPWRNLGQPAGLASRRRRRLVDQLWITRNNKPQRYRVEQDYSARRNARSLCLAPASVRSRLRAISAKGSPASARVTNSAICSFDQCAITAKTAAATGRFPVLAITRITIPSTTDVNRRTSNLWLTTCTTGLRSTSLKPLPPSMRATLRKPSGGSG